MIEHTKVRLLIADDHIVMREGLVTLLNNEPDFEVIGQASNGRETINIVNKCQPDIVLLDITLGDMTGLEAAKNFLPTSPKVKVIFLTMHEDSEFFLEALRTGASGYILKGSRTDVLLLAIRSVYQGGMYLSSELAGELVKEYLSRVPQPPTDNPLTEREKEVLNLIGHGLTNKEIAAQLGVSINTIKTHRLNIYQKLNLKGQTNLLNYALRQGLFYPPPTTVVS